MCDHHYDHPDLLHLHHDDYPDLLHLHHDYHQDNQQASPKHQHDHPHLLHLSKVVDEKDVDAFSSVLEVPTRVLEACVDLIEKDDDLLGHAADDDVIHLEYIPDSDEWQRSGSLQCGLKIMDIIESCINGN